MSLVTLAAFTACQLQEGPGLEESGDDPGAAVDTAAILASIDSLRSAYEQAVAEDDLERLGRMVTEDAVLVWPGTAAYDSLAAYDTPFPPGATQEINPWETRVLGPDWVYDMGTGTVTWTPEGADEPRTLQDTYLVLLHRTEEGWKVHREVASSRPLPATGGSSADGGG